MIDGKEAFLAHISRCLGRTEIPKAPSPFALPSDVHRAYLSEASSEELRRIFIRNAEANGTIVRSCPGPEALPDLIAGVLRKLDAEHVVVGRHEFFDRCALVPTLRERSVACRLWAPAKGREENIAAAERADAGIVMAECGLAESGTALLLSGGEAGRSVSLLPAYSLIVLRTGDLRPRLTQGMALLRERRSDLPASAVFVSGASSTADIELVPVRGVHGPLKLIYILVDR